MTKLKITAGDFTFHAKLETELSELKEEVTLAVIGCYVNGPGESKIADVGVTGADPKHLIYLGGKPA